MSQNNKRTRDNRNNRNSRIGTPSDINSPAGEGQEDSPQGHTPGTPGFYNVDNTQELFEDQEVDESEIPENIPNSEYGLGALPDSEDEIGEDLFGPDAANDYLPNPGLDQYEQADLDDSVYEAMDIGQRREVDNYLEVRDRQLNREPGAILGNGTGMEDPTFEKRRRRKLLGLDDIKIDNDDEIDLDITLEDLNDVKASSIAEWVAMEGPRRAINKKFKDFLLHIDEKTGRAIYKDKIRALGEGNNETLEISYNDLFAHNPVLAYILTHAPRTMIQIFDDVAFEIVLKNFVDYDKIHSEIHCRINDVPTNLSLRDLRQVHLNTLVKIFGVVSRRSSIFPQLKYVKFQCGKCNVILGPYYQDPSAMGEVKVGNCHNCESKGPFLFCSEQTVYRNYQKITLQETPGTVPPGRLPRHREVILLWDLVDSIKPGEEIQVTGIYMNNLDSSLNNKYGFPVFSTIIEANHIVKLKQNTLSKISEEDEKRIKELSQDDNVREKIIQSIAPSIFGHRDIKTCMAMSLFGGVQKETGGNHYLRGDINVLLLGDPGTAKSQFLKYAEKTAHRCVYATGQGASAVGLTASVRKDPVTREWTLEGGALVLADQGVCLIDEFDKMNEQDRTSIHEAMEQQSISISKAGIVTSLQARCSIIAAANPIRGRYNALNPLTLNVNLTEPILSRFDLVCIVRDVIDFTQDAMLAHFVINSHDNSHPYLNEENDNMSESQTNNSNSSPIPQDLLRKYITYARERCKPTLLHVNADKMSTFFAELRSEALRGGGLTITVRHLESIIRMSEAVARMHLRDHVRKDDLDFAISTFLESFIQTQKITIAKSMKQKFRKYIYVRNTFDILAALLGRMELEAINTFKAKNELKNLHGANDDDELNLPEIICINENDFNDRARRELIDETESFLSSNKLTEMGYTREELEQEDELGNIVRVRVLSKDTPFGHDIME